MSHHPSTSRLNNLTHTSTAYTPTGSVTFGAAQRSAVQALNLLETSRYLPLPIISRAEDLACVAERNKYTPVGRRSDRLEWLGDKFMHWVVGNLLHNLFPESNACQLTIIHGALTCNATFSSIAIKFGMILPNKPVKAGGDHFETFMMMACHDSAR